MGDQGLEDVPEVGNGGGNGAHRMQWSAAMSGFMLRRFAELVAEGVRTDKGFKDVHVNQVANQLSEFTGLHVVTSQVHNHLRKWRAKWTKICRLKDLSGAGWDEDLCMITLEQEHFNGHVKMKWYVVFKGHCPGVYDSWPECGEQVSGFSGNRYKSYKTKDEAVAAFNKFMEYEKSAAMVRQAVEEAISAGKAKAEEKKRATIGGKEFIICSLLLVVLIQLYIIFS